MTQTIAQIEKKIKTGALIEREHYDTYAFIRNYGLPDPETFFRMIAMDHIAENTLYYEILKKVGL